MRPFVNMFQGMINKLAHHLKVNALRKRCYYLLFFGCIRLCPESLKVTTLPEEVISQSYQMNKRCPTVSERDALLSEMNEKRVALGLAQISEHNFIKYIIRYQCWHSFIYLFCSFLHLIIAHINTCYDFFIAGI
jgi:hypothetical protein